MATNLANAIPSFLNYINPPGQTVYTMTDTEALSRLTDAFWTMRMNGVDFLVGWTCSNGIIKPQTNPSGGAPGYIPQYWYIDQEGSVNLGQEVVQAICLYAAMIAINAIVLNTKTQFAARSGGTSYEQQQSSSMLQTVLNTIKDQVRIVLTRLSDLGFTEVGVFDAVMQETAGIDFGSTQWVGGGSMGGGYGTSRGGAGW